MEMFHVKQISWHFHFFFIGSTGNSDEIQQRSLTNVI
jgi:hypothetical protein